MTTPISQQELPRNFSRIQSVPPAPRPLSPSRVASPTHGDVAQRAYDIYTESGYQQGQSLLNWLRAEKDLNERGAVVCHDEHRRKGVFAPDAEDAQ